MYNMCHRFFARPSKIRVEKETALKVKSDAVSALQELCSARGWQTPVYHSWTETILNRFQVDCSVYGNTVKGTEGIFCVLSDHNNVANNVKYVLIFRRRRIEKRG